MPLDSDALLDAGRRAHQAGDIDAAIAAYQAALRKCVNDPKILFLLGNIFLESGQADTALQYLEPAAARQRNHPAVIGSLAQAYFDAGRHADAENTFRKAVRLDPRAPQLQIGLANALAMQHKFAEAETLLKRTVVRFPDAAYAWMNLGNVARDQSRLEEAITHYREALRCDANLLDARNNLGSALHTLLRLDEAEREYRACTVSDPGFIVARANLVSVLIDLGRFGEAEAQCRSMLAAAPDFCDSHAMFAAAVASQGRLSEAIPHLQKAAMLSPEIPRYVTSYASALCEVGQIDEGLRLFANLLQQPGDTLTATQLVTSVLLANGYFGEGWSRFRQRQAFLSMRTHFERLNLQQSLPAALNGQLNGKHVCVMGEQGLGDELFFLRFIPPLKVLGARITYCTNSKLESMLQRVADIDAIVTTPDDVPAADANILVGDLPHALCEIGAPSLDNAVQYLETGTLLQAFPWQHAPYAPLPPASLRIAPLQSAVEQIRLQLARAGPPPYLAITWRGGTSPENQRGVEWKLFKEIGISALGQALSAWPGTFLALQRHPAEGELSALQSALGHPLADFTALNDDLERMLALLSVIDDYVGVSNTNMHLRAAVGKLARVLVPCPAEWRWMAAGDSPWFPGFGVYRQTPDGRWDGALTALRHDLAA